MSGPTPRIKLASLALILLGGALGAPCAAADLAPSSTAASAASSAAARAPDAAPPPPRALRTEWAFDRAALTAMGIRRPSRLAYDSEGNLHVLDAETRRVVKLDPRGRLLFDVGGYGADDASLQMPVDLVVDRNQSLLVLDRARGALVAFDRAGRFLALRPFQGAATDEASARGVRILLDSFGTLWLLATQARDLMPLTDRLTPARATRYLTPEDQVGFPVAAAQFDAGAWIYDAAQGAIRRFTSSGRFQLSISPEDSAGAFAPSDLAADVSGNLYVADEKGQRLLVFDPSGALLIARVLGGAKIPWRPAALAVGPGGVVAVADAERCEIQIFATDREVKP